MNVQESDAFAVDEDCSLYRRKASITQIDDLGSFERMAALQSDTPVVVAGMLEVIGMTCP
ncbi:MAG: hypothetical protein QGG73_09865 [Candidatus Hydrogenedentes bacterium]|jgi:hypothetical protein|nr:hypothetical protein [Candidatus Hydrogenedentota bacterium]